MKFYEFIEFLQKENHDRIVMVKSGAFFNAIGKDAIILDRVLGLKKTCHARFLCKCGMPVSYVHDNMEKFKKRLKEKNISIVIYDEMKNGDYRYKDRNYGILFELNGQSIKKDRYEIYCKGCERNIYKRYE